jgi:hypothetical protein
MVFANCNCFHKTIPNCPTRPWHLSRSPPAGRWPLATTRSPGTDHPVASHRIYNDSKIVFQNNPSFPLKKMRTTYVEFLIYAQSNGGFLHKKINGL